jgi:predicted HicB family RNase H-like nuclease
MIVIYKNYVGLYDFKEDEKVYFGKLSHIKDLITFEGETERDTALAFIEAVDDYLELKKIVNK